MVPAPSHKVSRVSWYSGSRCRLLLFAYGAFTLSGWLSQNHSAQVEVQLLRSEPARARTDVWALPGSLAATSGITFVFFSSGYLDVSVHRVPFLTLCVGVRMTEGFSAGFPHSEIFGSQDICSSPKLFAAYHVFHRLLVPRHPPYALFYMTKRLSKQQIICRPAGNACIPWQKAAPCFLTLHRYSVTGVGNRSIVLLRFLRRFFDVLSDIPRMS